MSAAWIASRWFADTGAPDDFGVEGARLVRLHTVREPRGHLTVGEIAKGLPFEVKRFFVISDVPSEDIRGEHAHRELHQFLVCLEGSVLVQVDDGRSRASVVLDSRDVGLHLPPMTWASQSRYASNAILLVLASAEYDAADYIREHARFVEEKARR